ncbi:RDD family protein [Planctomycetes bacterium Pla163]|uniref:RDD family protein n=1 Tax=Rohdeia mirabilis TaxID=2528008 RepID=A0A518CW93_9BACT|nr:RDD family protein [Planctomycetes bacterium Pla163]
MSALETPYAPPSAILDDRPRRLSRADLAGPGRRLVAWLVDSFLWLGPSVAGMLITEDLDDYMRRLDGGTFEVLTKPELGAILSTVIVLLAVQAISIHRGACSLGKRLLGIHVERLDGQRCGLVRYVFVRWFVVVAIAIVLEIVVGVGGVATVLLIFDNLLILGRTQRTLHDRIASTRVVRTRP